MAAPSRRSLNNEKVCENCGKTFLAKTAITRFCYDDRCLRDRNAKRKKVFKDGLLAPAPAKMKMKKRDLKEWNKNFPIGTRVILTKDTGEEVQTVIRSKGWLLGNGMPLVLVDGIRGGYSISRIRKDNQNAS